MSSGGVLLSSMLTRASPPKKATPSESARRRLCHERPEPIRCWRLAQQCRHLFRPSAAPELDKNSAAPLLLQHPRRRAATQRKPLKFAEWPPSASGILPWKIGFLEAAEDHCAVRTRKARRWLDLPEGCWRIDSQPKLYFETFPARHRLQHSYRANNASENLSGKIKLRTGFAKFCKTA